MADGNASKAPRQRIVEAAARLFAAKGFHSTPVSELAEAAQVSMGQLYRFFPGKDDIIVAIVQQNVEERSTMLDRVIATVETGETSPLDALRAYIEWAIDADRAGLQAEMTAEAHRNPRVREKVLALGDHCQEIHRRLVRVLAVDADPAEQGARADLLSTCIVGLEQKSLWQAELDVPKASAEAARLIARMLRGDG